MLCRYLFVLCFVPTVAFADADRREYVDWQSPQFSKIVKISSDKKLETFCTGQFVSPNIIITNAHCTGDCDDTDSSLCYITTSGGEQYYVKLLSHTNFDFEYHKQTRFIPDNGYAEDYAFLKVIDRSFQTSDFYDVSDDFYIGTVSVAGFGGLRILSDEELRSIKRLYIQNVLMPKYRDAWRQDHPKMKWEKYERKYIPNDDLLEKRVFMGVSPADIDDVLAENGIVSLFHDSENLKLHKDCAIIESNAHHVSSTCQAYGGNSGSGFIEPGGTLVGLYNSHQFREDVTDFKDKIGHGLASPVFYETYKNLIDNK